MTNPKLADIFAYVIKNANDDPEKMSMVLSSAVNSAYELGREDANEQLKAADRLASAVLVYWKNSRPCVFSEKEHRDNPSVNGFNINLYKAMFNYESRRKGTGEVGA